ncbi:hypothetical protein SAMD00020551_2814 [Mesobacillus selenatarsenatis SF-1]|uniref:Uncharacterized protein n=1 Tax=Mesobacillus selenatarsenatis (strain DSM 18680 / JCM 14380 / FERM P-15431 / SF-1) TaxID=1321606 RepID=A0A0A8X912_MESS1|nr:hypothetical protein SAMD00020551_2814 [Mesobacillus selenatarsenatis SF-1]
MASLQTKPHAEDVVLSEHGITSYKTTKKPQDTPVSAVVLWNKH